MKAAAACWRWPGWSWRRYRRRRCAPWCFPTRPWGAALRAEPEPPLFGLQNQSIDDSDAGLARDLRLLVRERLAAGDDDAAVIDFVVARYGDYVLLTPPVKPAAYALWFGPPLLLAAGGLLIFSAARRRRHDERQRALAPLTRAERARLARLLDGGGDEPPAGRA